MGESDQNIGYGINIGMPLALVFTILLAIFTFIVGLEAVTGSKLPMSQKVLWGILVVGHLVAIVPIFWVLVAKEMTPNVILGFGILATAPGLVSGVWGLFVQMDFGDWPMYLAYALPAILFGAAIFEIAVIGKETEVN